MHPSNWRPVSWRTCGPPGHGHGHARPARPPCVRAGSNASASATVLAALAAARRGDASWLAGISASPLPPTPPALIVGPRTITETGPLAAFASAGWDAVSRRVLPANLLRRCRLVGSLATVPRSAHTIRAGVVAASGEEALLELSLVMVMGGGGNGGEDSAWRVASVRAVAGSVDDATADDDPLAAPGPHPRAGPEAAALAAARLLASGSLAAAAAFAAGPRGGPARGLALAPAAAALAGAEPGRLVVQASAGPTLRTCVVEVVEEGREGRHSRALFDLCLKDSGCWAVRGTEGW